MSGPVDAISSKPRMKPRVGIWWLVGKTIVSFTESADQICVVHAVRDSDLAHVDVWPQVVKRFDKLRGRGYEFVPRGRILQSGNVFHILMPASLAQDQRVVKKLLIRFKLLSHPYRLVVDEHYNPPDAIDWED